MPTPTPEVIEATAGWSGPDIATLLISIIALGLSGWSFWRSRTPKPHWEFLQVRREEQTEYNTRGPVSDWTHRTVYVFWADVRQNGPGNAESLRTRIKPPSGEWTEWQSLGLENPVVVRGNIVYVRLANSHEVVSGEYSVEVEYRCLPDTTKPKLWKTKALVAA